jgi:PAS domain S-box-containing protein
MAKKTTPLWLDNPIITLIFMYSFVVRKECRLIINNRFLMVLVTMLVLLFSLNLATICHAQESPPRNILLLNSYHQTMRWTQDMVAAIYEELQPDNNNLQLFIENMDTKRIYNETYLSAFAQLLKAKYRDTAFDLILITDNNAFDFMRQHRDQLFPQSPVIFCGINNLDRKSVEGFTNFTGIEEIFDTAATIDLALQNHPNTKDVFVVNDYLTTGRAINAKMREQLEPYKNKLKIHYNDDLSIAALNAQIRALKPGSIVLLGAFYSARQETHVPGFYQSGMRLVEGSQVPIYAIYDFNIHEGVIGGKVASSAQQGKAIALLAKKILAEIPLITLPVIQTGKTEYIFNFETLKRFSIDEADLPKGSIIRNKPFSIYQQYQHELILIVISIFLLLIIICTLLISISRRHQAEQKLRENELKLKTIFNQSHAFLSLIAVDGRLLDINQSALSFCGRRKKAVLNRPFWDTGCWKNPEDKQLLRRTLKRAAEGEIVQYELTAISADNKQHIFDVTLSPIFDKKGRTACLVFESHDITQQRKLAEQLRHAHKMEAIGTLAGGIAHDFNNILSGILGFSEMNQLTPNCPESIRINSRKINSAALRGRELVLQILTFSRKDNVHNELVRIDQIVQEAVDLLEKTMAINLQIQVDIDPQTGGVVANKAQLHQVVMNLCTNACQAIGPKKGKIFVSLKAVTIDRMESYGPDTLPPGNFARLQVRDTGTGIETELLERIYDPFFTTKNPGEGTGLGLSVVHGIVQNLGGCIDVKSQIGSGTVFTVWIPLSDQVPEEVTKPEDITIKTTGHEHILWVDDEAMLVTLGQQFLESLGYRVTAMKSPKEALLLFEKQPYDFDLIFSDLVMPELSGDQLTKAALKIRKDIPIILCSGHSETLDKIKVIQFGARDLLTKPIRLKNLAKKIRTVLDSAN